MNGIDRLLAKLAQCPPPKPVITSVQAYRLVAGEVIEIKGCARARIISLRPMDTSALPMLELCARPLEGDVARQRLIFTQIHASTYVTRVVWYREQPDLFSAPDVLHLVSCVSMKRPAASPARELYISPWFRAARAHVEPAPWRILSARHGLVHPTDFIEPYEERLTDRPRAARREWARRILTALPVARRYVIWAGAAYSEFLASTLNAELPLRGLGIGEQLAFFKERAADRKGEGP